MTRREILWAWLTTHPGLTAYELARTALRTSGPAIHSGSVRRLLVKMEADDQVTRTLTMHDGQGQPVSEWHAVPGAFAIEPTAQEVSA
jgi:hypothetical protein